MPNCIPPLRCVIWGSRTLDSYLGAEVCVTGRIKRDYCVRCQGRWVPPLSSCLCLELLILLTSQLDLKEADFSNKILLNLSWLNLSLSGSSGNESFYSLMVHSGLWALMRGGWRRWNGIQRIFGEVESTAVLSVHSGVRLSRLTSQLHHHQLNYPEQWEEETSLNSIFKIGMTVRQRRTNIRWALIKKKKKNDHL